MNTSLLARGLYLEYLTLAWNVIGSVIIIGAAYLAGSVALAGFGIDSLIEISASVVVVVIAYYGTHEGLHAYHESTNVEIEN